jgi:hypothetical protein
VPASVFAFACAVLFATGIATDTDCAVRWVQAGPGAISRIASQRLLHACSHVGVYPFGEITPFPRKHALLFASCLTGAPLRQSGIAGSIKKRFRMKFFCT